MECADDESIYRMTICEGGEEVCVCVCAQTDAPLGGPSAGSFSGRRNRAAFIGSHGLMEAPDSPSASLLLLRGKPPRVSMQSRVSRSFHINLLLAR